MVPFAWEEHTWHLLSHIHPLHFNRSQHRYSQRSQSFIAMSVVFASLLSHDYSLAYFLPWNAVNYEEALKFLC